MTDETEEKQEQKTEAVDFKDLLQRVQADFENFKKRTERLSQEKSIHAKAELISKLLPVLDSFELALKSSEFGHGMKLLYSQFMSVLEKEGLRRINAQGKKFDTYLHEVMLTEESDKEGIVLEELQGGYKVGDIVIRHSKVKIGKNKLTEVNQND